MHIDAEGYRYRYRPGDQVAVRKDLVFEKEYHSLFLSPDGCTISSLWWPEKQQLCFDECDGVVTIKDCHDGYYEIEEDWNSDWYFVDGMFIGLVDEACPKDIEISDLDKILL